MMNYLTNIMGIGNRIILLFDNSNRSKMFPFDDMETSLIPLAHTNLLDWNLSLIREKFKGDVDLIGPFHSEILELCDKFSVSFTQIEVNFLRQIYDISQHNDKTIILNNNIVLSDNLIDDILKNETNKAYISHFDEMIQSNYSMGASIEGDKICRIFGHARPHYVDGYLVGIYKLDNEFLKALKYTSKGFNNVNCGQMPPNDYFIENALNNALEKGNVLNYKWLKRNEDFTQLNYVWEIIESNLFVSEKIMPTKSIISQSATISKDCDMKGTIRIGDETTISKSVTIGRNCWIGKNVIIENNVVIGDNCIINDGSIINHFAKINNNTIIGKNNKIGYLAEVSGVTFDGVSAIHNCGVYGIIGRKVDIAAGVQMAILRFDDEKAKIRIKGKQYINRFTNYVAIGNYTRTGVNNVYAPGVRVGSKCAISPSVIVNRDLAAGKILLLKQEVVTEEWGSDKYGW